jgi:molybdopterin-guanine dinucleotide biosynthesis protein A
VTFPPSTIGAILAGGLAQRMGGGDKAMRGVGVRTLLMRLISRLSPQVRRSILNANGDPGRVAGLGLAVAADSLPDYPGPLAGVLAALEWASAEASGIEWVVTVPCDTPFLPTDLAERLHAARLRGGAVLACAASAGRTHPVIALWPVKLAAPLRRAIQVDGIRKVGRFTGLYPCAIAEWDTDPVDPFFNVNTAEDLAEAERLAKAYPGM